MYEDSHLESAYEDAYAGTGYDGYESYDDEPEWYCPSCDCLQSPVWGEVETEGSPRVPTCSECGTDLESD